MCCIYKKIPTKRVWIIWHNGRVVNVPKNLNLVQNVLP
jgi:hypothetical protein